MSIAHTLYSVGKGLLDYLTVMGNIQKMFVLVCVGFLCMSESIPPHYVIKSKSSLVRQNPPALRTK
jgi:hypothetical protein